MGAARPGCGPARGLGLASALRMGEADGGGGERAGRGRRGRGPGWAGGGGAERLGAHPRGFVCGPPVSPSLRLLFGAFLSFSFCGKRDPRGQREVAPAQCLSGWDRYSFVSCLRRVPGGDAPREEAVPGGVGAGCQGGRRFLCFAQVRFRTRCTGFSGLSSSGGNTDDVPLLF